jgi:hypothetical protein
VRSRLPPAPRAGERDIYTGDAVDICIINAAGIRHESLQLKLD